MQLIAHVKPLPDGTWAEPHWLEKHLEGTAAKAAEFAGAFRSKTWGRALGMVHDIGKSPQKWQQYLCRKSGYDEEAHLEGKTGKLDHSSPGAKLVEQEEVFGKAIGRILAYCIAGHHAGLPDWYPDEAGGALSIRLGQTETSEICPELISKISALKPSGFPWKFENSGLDLSLWVRMLFSCLVDADFLDTEIYMEPEKANLRGGYLSIKELLERLDGFMAKMTATSEKSSVNEVRQLVLAECRKAAAKAPGIYSLTVPTGGGKTLSR